MKYPANTNDPIFNEFLEAALSDHEAIVRQKGPKYQEGIEMLAKNYADALEQHGQVPDVHSLVGGIGLLVLISGFAEGRMVKAAELEYGPGHQAVAVAAAVEEAMGRTIGMVSTALALAYTREEEKRATSS